MTQNERYDKLLSRLLATTLYQSPRPSIETAEQLCALFDHPQDRFPTIHVTGTNGKGSVALKVARAFELSGYRTGLFTSPHLNDFCERIQINSEMANKEEIADLLESLFEKAEEYKIVATFFELTTALAFLYFALHNVDVAIIEVGIGGRLDATNIIKPQIGIITSIGWDHTEKLGHTKEQIACEKAGIAKSHLPIVLGPTAWSIPSIKEIIQKKGGTAIEVPVTTSPFYDDENRMTAAVSLHVLSQQFHLRESAIDIALTERPPCRFEVIKGQFAHGAEAIVFDAAHNPCALKRLFEALYATFPLSRKRVVFGMSRDKEIGLSSDFLATQNIPVHLVQASTQRAAPISELHALLTSHGCQAFCEGSVSLGMKKALKQATLEKEVVVVCGSFYIMKEAKDCLSRPSPFLQN